MENEFKEFEKKNQNIRKQLMEKRLIREELLVKINEINIKLKNKEDNLEFEKKIRMEAELLEIENHIINLQAMQSELCR